MLIPLRARGWPATVLLLVFNAAMYALHLLANSFEMIYWGVSLALGLFFVAWVAPGLAGVFRTRREAGDQSPSADASLRSQ